MKNIITVFSLLIFITSGALAQTGSIRGFVYEKESGEPVIFTNVYLKGTTIGASTDVNGFYQILKVPVGTYQLTVSSLGFDTLRKEITVKAGDIISEKLFVLKSSIRLNTIDISAEKEEAQTEVKTSVKYLPVCE